MFRPSLGSSSGPLGKQIQEIFVFQCIEGSQINKNSILSGGHVSTFIWVIFRPSGKKRFKSYLYFKALRDPKSIKTLYCQGEMFRPLLGHLQALWENRSKSYLYFNALRDPKSKKKYTVRATCFDLY